MARKGFKRNFPPLEILRKEDTENIKIASFDILKETGIVIQHKGALDLLKKNGCIVDYENKRVRIPEGLVTECLHKCPSSFRVKARDPNNDLIFGGNTVYFNSSPGMDAVDLNTWRHRTATEAEFIDAIKVLDALENLDWHICYTPYFGYKGVAESMKMTVALVKRIKYSTKFSAMGFANFNWDFNLRIAEAAGTEVMCPAFMVSSPLTVSEFAIEATFKTLEYGFPIGVDTGPLFGATAPATLAGALALFNAELLAGIVLIQLKKPYSRVLIWGFPNPLNMRTGAPYFGNIANSLFYAVSNQIWRDYGVPVKNTAAIYSNSKKIDFQNGIERSIPAILSAVSGAHTINLHGGMYGEITHSPIQSILDDDLAGMIGRFIEGIDVKRETLALDLIHAIGPAPGHYLDTEHTFKWWRKEQYVQKCADLLTYSEWECSGEKDCIDLAKERMKKILEEHNVSIELPKEKEEEISKIVNEAYEYYRKKGEIN